MTRCGPLRALLFAGAATVAFAGCAGGFAPQGSPAATDIGSMGCQVAAQPGAVVRQGDPLAPGQPMAGVDVGAMTPRQVGELARSRGLKVTWRYAYAIGGDAAPTDQTSPGPTATERAVASADAMPSPSLPVGGVAGVIGAAGFSECWCQPPPDGTVISVAYGMASELIVFVDAGLSLPAPRAQPARGWGC